MPKVVLDAETFKVLASDTRLSILKSLDERPKTVSELSRELELNKATVFEHLKSLIDGELVKKQEREGRKWVYYKLGWKGRSLLHPEHTTVMVLLSLGLLGSTGALVQLANWLRWWSLGNLPGDGAATGDDETVAEALPEQGTPESAAASEEAPPDSDQTETAEMQESARASEGPDDGLALDGTGSDGGFFDVLDDPGFYWFALLAVVGLSALIAAGLIRRRARLARDATRQP